MNDYNPRNQINAINGFIKEFNAITAEIYGDIKFSFPIIDTEHNKRVMILKKSDNRHDIFTKLLYFTARSHEILSKVRANNYVITYLVGRGIMRPVTYEMLLYQHIFTMCYIERRLEYLTVSIANAIKKYMEYLKHKGLSKAI